MTSPESEPHDAPAEASTHDAEIEASEAETQVQTEAEAEAQAQELGDEWLGELPQEVIAWLVRSLPTRELWDWLGDEARGNLRLVMLSGFRAAPANLKQPAVAKKLAKHAVTHIEILRGLIDLWRGGHQPLFEAIAERDDESLSEILPALLHSHGGEALLLALAASGRHKALDALASLGSEEGSEDKASISVPEEVFDGATGTSSAEPISESGASEEAARMRSLLDEARERAAKLQAGLSAAVSRVEKERDKVLLKAREADRAFKALENRANRLEAESAEAKRLLDRSERRGRQWEREKDELEADNKKLRRQMRRQQEISEEIRKHLARANAQIEEISPPASTSASASTSANASASTCSAAPAPKGASKTTSKGAAAASAAAAASKALAPLDREYVLRADGRQVSVTPRQVKQRVDANDEEWVFRLIQALEAVAQVDAAGHKTFVEAIKPLGPYYRRVLTADTLRVLVDASNVVRFEKDHLGRGYLSHLLEMRDELRRRDCFPIKLIADASLPYFIDDTEEFLAMTRRGEVELSIPGQEADEILAREARRTGAYVVTNDRLFFHKATPDFEPPRITFRIIAGHLIVDEF